MALCSVGQEDGDAGGERVVPEDVGGVYTGGREAAKCNAAEIICADEAGEGDARAEQGGVVRDDGRGAAECRAEAAGEDLDFELHVSREPVENEVEVEFAGDGDVEGLLHGFIPSGCLRIQR